MENVRKVIQKEPILEPLVQSPMMKSMDPKQKDNMKLLIAGGILLLAAVLGVGTGWAFAKKAVASSGNSSVGVKTNNSVATDTEAGINDDAAFPDTAQGVLQDGGIKGEGTHHLDRSAQNEKDAALSSTVINLANFVGKKVEVRGQTISSKTSGWLMDVGKIKVIE